MEVKCISIRNPFAHLICAGGKDVENRSWKTDYRGRLYIHASGDPMPFTIPERDYPKSLKNDDANILYLEKVRQFHKQVINFYEKAGLDITGKELLDDSDLWFLKNQAIIGYVDLVDIVENSKSPWAAERQKHWILQNPVMLDKPILLVQGKLSIWKFNIG